MGIDDALALFFLNHFARPPVDCIVATGGNVRAELVANNCAFLKEAFGLRADIYAGAGRGARFVADLVRHARRAHVLLGQGDGVFMHDVVAIAVRAGMTGADWRTASVREVVAGL